MNEENFFYCPFAYSEIGHFEIRSRVQAIHDRTFYQTVFRQPEVELAQVDSTSLFYDAKISELSLVETMDRIPDYLFANAELQMKEYVIDREYIGKIIRSLR